MDTFYTVLLIVFLIIIFTLMSGTLVLMALLARYQERLEFDERTITAMQKELDSFWQKEIRNVQKDLDKGVG